MKGFLDKLIREQRIDVKNPLAKEVQQYAEEVVWRAKQNTPFHDNVVESMLISPEARQVLYEHLVPRYAHRPSSSRGSSAIGLCGSTTAPIFPRSSSWIAPANSGQRVRIALIVQLSFSQSSRRGAAAGGTGQKRSS